MIEEGSCPDAVKCEEIPVCLTKEGLARIKDRIESGALKAEPASRYVRLGRRYGGGRRWPSCATRCAQLEITR